MQPTIGRIVHYQLTDGDVLEINTKTPMVDDAGRRAARNHVAAGQVYPAMVVRVFDPSTTTVNLQVFLDGDSSHWATSRHEGDRPGCWSWPARSANLDQLAG